MKVRSSRKGAAFMATAMLAHLACGRPEESSLRPQGPSGVPAATVTATIPKAMSSPAAPPESPWVPPGTYACALGKGDPTAYCRDRGGLPVFLEQVNAAIDEVVLARPELVDRTRVVGENGYLVLDSDRFYLAVAEALQTKGLCAGWDLKELQVRNSAGFSEQYDLVLANGHIRRGAGSFRTTCMPASFPLDPADRIDSVRVGFYGLVCEDGRTPPRNGEAKLPVECTGFVTATPKDKEGKDVDRRIHGPYITWELQQIDDYVFVEDFQGVDFNKQLRGIDPGSFALCATVQTHKSCLYASVTAKE